MILQALTNHYETLAAKGALPPEGWEQTNVSYALEILEDGRIIRLLSLAEDYNGKKKHFTQTLPLTPPGRTSNVSARFLCDNGQYILGLPKSNKSNDKKHALECFEDSKRLHLTLLSSMDSPVAKAICNFFIKWDPINPAITLMHDVYDELSSANITFLFNDQYARDYPELDSAWNQRYFSYLYTSDTDKSVCLIEGEKRVIEQVHPKIKGVKGAQSSGASIVSNNGDAFTSFGKEQSNNAPVSKYAAFAYTTALNHLLADASHRKFIGDATVVYWAENGESAEQDFMSALFDGGDERITDEVLDDTIKRFATGQAIDLEGITVSPDDRFFILALSPNNARVSVRFFYDTSFGDIARNFSRFYEELSITGAKKHIPLWQILNETARKSPDGKANPSPEAAGDTLRAVITGCDFPETLYQSILLRIRSEKEIRAVKAAAIKAFLLRNRRNHPDYPEYKEVLGVKLNEETTYLPYVLGELFAVLEAVQETASGVTTIKDRYFTSACTTPAIVFPRLIELANHHLRKLDGGTKIYYARELGMLMAKVGESYPAQMNLNDQGIFQIGYYHKRQRRFEGKTQENKTEE